jgi:hypothetical protein
MLDWAEAHKSWFVWLAVISAVTLAASVLVIPWLIAKLPADYFARNDHPAAWTNAHPLLRALLLALKNLFGLVLIVLGILMLVLPGQGVLTIVAGIALVDFPGRHRVVQWIVGRDPVINALNWVRRRANRPEFHRVGAA